MFYYLSIKNYHVLTSIIYLLHYFTLFVVGGEVSFSTMFYYLLLYRGVDNLIRLSLFTCSLIQCNNFISLKIIIMVADTSQLTDDDHTIIHRRTPTQK